MPKQHTLARHIGTPLLTLYGLGTILGAGIYVLIGKVAGSAGMLAPLSFLLAAGIAWITALSYSQLVILFPRSAGEAVYVEQAFHARPLTLLMGLLIIFTGIVSAATLTNGFVGYFSQFFSTPPFLSMILVVVALTVLASWGIAESLWVAAIITALEIGGLILIIYFCGNVLSELPQNYQHIFFPNHISEIIGLLAGTFLAFYAFIGFEDMVNIVEEVKNPKKTMPKAILLAIIASTILYALIALIAVLSLPVATLSDSNAPLTLLIQNKGFASEKIIGVIGIIAIVNGVLVQLIMASRVIYGMAIQYNGPSILSSINQKTLTPIPATLIVAVLILIFALFLPLETLAKLTSFIILIVFSFVNIALWKISADPAYQNKIQQSETQLHQYPVLGASLCIGLLVFQVFHLFSQ